MPYPANTTGALTSPSSEKESAMTSFDVLKVVEPTTARDPPSRLPAVKVKGTNISLRPGSGLAPRRDSCAAM